MGNPFYVMRLVRGELSEFLICVIIRDLSAVHEGLFPKRSRIGP